MKRGNIEFNNFNLISLISFDKYLTLIYILKENVGPREDLDLSWLPLTDLGLPNLKAKLWIAHIDWVNLG